MVVAAAVKGLGHVGRENHGCVEGNGTRASFGTHNTHREFLEQTTTKTTDNLITYLIKNNISSVST